jgi:hypothetical protein
VPDLLARLKRTTVAELQFRGRERARLVEEAVGYRLGSRRWQPRRLIRALEPRSGPLAEARQALEGNAGNTLTTAERALRRHFLDRAPRFVISPADRPALTGIIRAVWPSAPADAARRAGRILDGRYALLGYHDLSFRDSRGEIDWHLDPVNNRRAPEGFWKSVAYLEPANGDHKIIWELNRHQHWLVLGRAAWLTGDPRYAAHFSRELHSWLSSNPPLSGINWASMLELAFRCLSWLWALHLFSGADLPEDVPWTLELLLGLEQQLDHIARHLSRYFSPNTHLLGEGLALYVAGRTVPEFAHASRWETIGREVLLRESHAQVNADGGHAELSTHYHRYALDFYLLALAVARRTSDAGITGRLEETAARLATYCHALADDRGWLPTIGDDDGGSLFPICRRPPADAADSLSLAAALLTRPELAMGPAAEEVTWMTGALPPPADPSRPPSSAYFPETGYAVLRSRHDHAVVDVGPHGFLNGGHAHADALSLVLTIDGRELLIDPGTCTYTMDPAVRDLFRSTPMHNTLAIGGRSQSKPAGPFKWNTTTDARVDCVRLGQEGDYVEASHEAYSPRVHRRGVLRAPSGLWVIVDHILGPGSEEASLYWHFHPDWDATTTPDGSGLRLAHAGGAEAMLQSTGPGVFSISDGSGPLDWYAPVYGTRVRTRTAVNVAEGPGPLSWITCVVSGAGMQGLRNVQLAANTDGWHRTAAILDSERLTALMFAAPLGSGTDPDRPREVQQLVIQGGGLHTDARVVLLELTPDGLPMRLIALAARTFTWEGRGAFSIRNDGAQDLHLTSVDLERLSQRPVAAPIG